MSKDKPQENFRRAPFLIAIGMYWVRGALYVSALLVVWYFVDPVIPQLMELTGSGSALVTFSLLVLVGPLILGWLAARIFNPLVGMLLNRRDIATLEDRLVTELAPGSSRGFPVVLAMFPTERVKAMGVVTSTFPSPSGSGNLATVYFPNTPDPTGGALRVLAEETLEYTDWTLRDLLRYQYSYGATGQDLESDQLKKVVRR